MAATSMEFDTTTINSPVDSDKRFQLCIYLAVFSIVTVSSLYLAARDSRILFNGPVDGGSPTGFDLAVWIICAFAASVAVYGTLDLRRGASRVRVGDDGLYLTFPGGRTIHVPWGQSKAQLTLREWPSLPSQGYALGVGRVYTRIPPDAYSEILRRAEVMKMGIEVRSGFAVTSTFRPRVTYIWPLTTITPNSAPVPERRAD
jgi:hypothetical protein